MTISAKTEYACIAMLELATSHGADEPVRIRDIADKHGIPSRFLVQILLQLKGAGLVRSTRGAAGGYKLARDPKRISLWDVMSVIEGPAQETAGSTGFQTPHVRALWRTWKQVAKSQRQLLDEISFADLAERVKAPHESMYYI